MRFKNKDLTQLTKEEVIELIRTPLKDLNKTTTKKENFWYSAIKGLIESLIPVFLVIGAVFYLGGCSIQAILIGIGIILLVRQV